MRTITVPATKRDEKVFTAQKYGNNASWNTDGGTAPSGVHATRYMRPTTPDVAKLAPLAHFLYENCPGCVVGNYPHPRIDARVRCYNGKTKAEMMRENWKQFYGNLIYGLHNTVERAKQIAENFIHVYGLERELCRIDDWRFSIIDPMQTDEDYWNTEAQKMIAAGSVRVTIGAAEWRG